MLMPKEGWKSITVRQDVYDYFKKQYEKRKLEEKLESGVTSFSGYVNHLLYKLMKQEKKHNP